MKIIVIGASLSGKTSIIRELLENPKLNISEMDEELTKLNGGSFPSDNDEKHNVLAPKVIEKVISSENIIFFTNTDYFSIEDLEKAKEKGFKIVQLDLALEKLLARNKSRVANEGYSDLSEWLPGMVEYQKKIFKSGVVDKVVDAGQPVERVAEEIINLALDTRGEKKRNENIIYQTWREC